MVDLIAQWVQRRALEDSKGKHFLEKLNIAAITWGYNA